MKTGQALEIVQQLGADRVIAPAGALPQPAERLDASGPVRPYEFEVEVERLCLDSTSFRNIRERSSADPGLMAARILEYRQKSGGFKKVEELMNVKGIGEKSFLKLKPLITVTAGRGERASHE